MVKRVIFSAVVFLASAIVAPNPFAQAAETSAPSAPAVVETNNPVLATPTSEAPVAAIQTNVEKAVESTVAVTAVTAAATGTQAVQAATSAVVGAESPVSAIVPEMSDAVSETLVPWQEPESRTRRAMRINREILLVTVPILAFFIIARIALLWKISSNRKRIARENNTLEP